MTTSATAAEVSQWLYCFYVYFQTLSLINFLPHPPSSDSNRKVGGVGEGGAMTQTTRCVVVETTTRWGR